MHHDLSSLILPAIHLSVLVGFLVYMTKTPFGNFVRGRHKEVYEGLNRSKRQASEASAKQKEVEAKFAAIESEKQKILADTKANQEAQVRAAKEASARVIAQMKIESEQNKKALEEVCRQDAVKSLGAMVLAQTEKKIRESLTAESHKKLNERFIEGLGA